MWKKCDATGQATGDNIIQRMRFAFWITRVTHTLSEYIICIAFPRQQWLRERDWMLRLYIHGLFCNILRGVTSVACNLPGQE
jgi:hypothetical protein